MLLITWMQRYQYRSTEPATSVREDYVHIYRPRRVGLNCKVNTMFRIGSSSIWLLITWMQRYHYRSTEPATSVHEDYVHIYRPRRVGLNCKVV
uniref:Uncharacterized protein n=1 Tax=Helianthus annuus TaxID=4232 RepID=A0A251UTJ0_HELAN